MSLKGTITTTDYLDFDMTLNRSMKIIKSDNKFRIGFLIVVGINTGLRISDILSLKYSDLSSSHIEIWEKKTKKYRKITINENIRVAYKLFLNRIENSVTDENELIFKSQKNSVYAVRSVNRELKNLLSDKKKNLNISSHSMRKTFGRRVFLNNNENEKSLIYLSDMFNHSSVSITRRYLGIRQEEIENIYLSL